MPALRRLVVRPTYIHHPDPRNSTHEKLQWTITEQEEMAIEVKQAVEEAVKYANELYAPDVVGVRLEEVERAEEGGIDVWRITLSFYVPAVEHLSTPMDRLLAQASIISSGGIKMSHQFKIFVVDARDGTVRAMRIRQV
jgi:hypothetical protein